MTCIVAVEYEGKVWMGGDSAATRDDHISRVTNEKVFITDDFIIGYCGSFRVGQVLQYSFKPPQQDIARQTDMEYLTIDFVDSLKDLLREKGLLLNGEDGESFDSELLIGYHGKIYSLERDFHITRPIDSYAVCGSGMSYALGAMFVQDEDESAVSRITKSLKASATFSTTVSAPFTILSL